MVLNEQHCILCVYVLQIHMELYYLNLVYTVNSGLHKYKKTKCGKTQMSYT